MSPKKSLSYKQLQKNRWFLVALTLGLVVVVVAIFLELVQSQRTSQVDPKLKKHAIPLSPVLSDKVFAKLDTYTYLSPEEARAEVGRLPIRVIDRETKQIVILQDDGSIPSTRSAKAITPEESSLQPSAEDAQDQANPASSAETPDSVNQEGQDAPPEENPDATPNEGE